MSRSSSIVDKMFSGRSQTVRAKQIPEAGVMLWALIVREAARRCAQAVMLGQSSEGEEGAFR